MAYHVINNSSSVSHVSGAVGRLPVRCGGGGVSERTIVARDGTVLSYHIMHHALVHFHVHTICPSAVIHGKEETPGRIKEEHDRRWRMLALSHIIRRAGAAAHWARGALGTCVHAAARFNP